MVKRLLITTAQEESWGDQEPVLFLGEWCRLHARRDRWSSMDATVLAYHWDDRAKLHADYGYLQDLHERLLSELAGQLNLIHGVSHGVRYWRILIGPWLGYFSQILLDRWISIQQAVSQHDLSGTIVLTGSKKIFVPNDMVDFVRLFLSDDWNHHIYTSILKGFTTLPLTERARPGGGEIANPLPAPAGLKRRISLALKRIFHRTAGGLVRESDCFLLNTDMPFFEEIRLYLRLGQVPVRWRSIPPVKVAANEKKRQWVVRGESLNAFEACIRALIPKQMPTAYLEGYGQLLEQIASLSWPKQPKLIWTSNSLNSDEVFKAWAAGKAESGSPLVAGQHGGFYGIGRWSFNEDHEIASSDCFLSWGWSESAQPKIRPTGRLKKKSRLGVQYINQPGAMLVTCIIPRQSYWMFSVVIATQWLDYFNDQCTFVRHLPAAIRDVLTVRLHSRDYGWDQVSRWRECFPALRLDAGQSDINSLIRRSRLYISTYNATTYLESFSMDVPTIIYWNPKQWELRDSAMPYFDELKRVGIFHESPESAARHVATIWDDVGAWWNSPEVRDVLARFKQRYCHFPGDLVSQAETALRDVIATTNTRRVDTGAS